MNTVILYIATSQDGFIADAQGGVDWLPQPKNTDELDIVGYTDLMQRISIIAMGNNSYQQILGFGDWGWPDKQTYVFSFEPQKAPLLCISFTSDSPKAFVEKISKEQPGKNIWLLGGAQLAQSFARDQLIDEIILTIVPQKIGNGIALNIPLDGFELVSEKPLFDGMIQRIYKKNSLNHE